MLYAWSIQEDPKKAWNSKSPKIDGNSVLSKRSMRQFQHNFNHIKLILYAEVILVWNFFYYSTKASKPTWQHDTWHVRIGLLSRLYETMKSVTKSEVAKLWDLLWNQNPHIIYYVGYNSSRKWLHGCHITLVIEYITLNALAK